MSNQIKEAGPSSSSHFSTSNFFVCFMPKKECVDTIINYILYAQEKIILQAYSFSSPPIAKALIDAKERGTSVTLFVDKDAEGKSGSLIPKLRKKGIEIQVDEEVDEEDRKAHNKVMIIDSEFVITGSYNWTDIKRNRDSDVIFFIRSKCVREMFMRNYRYNLQRTNREDRLKKDKLSSYWNQMQCGSCTIQIEDLPSELPDDEGFKIVRNTNKQLKSENDAIIRGCFPRFENQNCIAFITEYIEKARELIYVNAYSFTHKTISDALIEAHERKIDVKLLVDQNVFYDKQDKVRLLYQKGISVKKNVICKIGLAHDKTIIIDNNIILSGSFNLTYSAQKRNLENVLCIKNTRVNKMFKDHFMSFWEKSEEVNESGCILMF